MASRSVSCSVDGALELLGAAVRDVLAVLRVASPGSISGDEARAFVDLFAQAERAASSGIALYAPRVLETGAHAKAGHGTAAQWLAAVAGSSAAAAKDRLAAAKAAGADEALTGALHGGGLSSSELKLMGAAEASAPGSARALVELAGAGRRTRAQRHRGGAAGRGAEQRERTGAAGTGPCAASRALAPVPTRRGQGRVLL